MTGVPDVDDGDYQRYLEGDEDDGLFEASEERWRERAEAGESFMAEMVGLFPWLPAAARVYRACLQADEWCDQTGRVWQFDEMALSHVTNLIRWLEARAEKIRMAAELDMSCAVALHDGGEHAHDSMESELGEIEDMDPVEFVRGTRLHRALVARRDAGAAAMGAALLDAALLDAMEGR